MCLGSCVLQNALKSTKRNSPKSALMEIKGWKSVNCLSKLEREDKREMIAPRLTARCKITKYVSWLR